MKKLLIGTLLLMLLLSGCKSSISPIEQQAQDEISNEVTEVPETEQNEMTEISETEQNEMTEAAEIPEIEQLDFRTEDLYDSHYEKHKNEFGDITKEEYLDRANALINAQGDNILTKNSKDGDVLFFNTDTNEFLVLSPEAYIRTYFISDSGISYYEKQ